LAAWTATEPSKIFKDPAEAVGTMTDIRAIMAAQERRFLPILFLL
jgi:hypothetical protein